MQRAAIQYKLAVTVRTVHHFRHNQLLVLCALVFIGSVFKSYHTNSDMSLCCALLPLFTHNFYCINLFSLRRDFVFVFVFFFN